MSNFPLRSIAGVVLCCALAPAHPVEAQLGVGTWARTASPQTPGKMTMQVEVCCGDGRRLTYRIEGADFVMVVESAFDGREVPVLINGKESGETMAITRTDARHTSTVLRLNGKIFGTSKAELSADGRTLTVHNEMSAAAGGHPEGKQEEVWVKQ